ncbi:N-lysine methyltransferase smyd2 [Rhodotorula toruloides]
MLGIPILFRNEFLAAIKLINCTLVGVSMCNVDMQFDGSRGNPTGFSDETHSRAWKVIQQVYATMKAKTAEADRAWTALLYNWEPVTGWASHESDFSHLVFGDGGLDRFLLVELRDSLECPCCTSLETEVRATWTCKEHPLLPPSFFDFSTSSLPSPNPSARLPKPQIIHLTPSDLEPIFTAADLVAFDTTLRNENKPAPGEERKRLVRVEEGDEGMTRWKTRNPFLGAHDQPILRMCMTCRTMDLITKRSRCSGCKMIFYCGPQCQREHWPEHKIDCVPAKKKK